MNRIYLFFLFSLLTIVLIGQKSPTAIIDSANKGTVVVKIQKTISLGARVKDFRGQLSEDEWQKSLQELKVAKGSIGSGFAINYHGRLFIVTNFHVIQAADSVKGSIMVETINNTSFPARYIDGDPFIDVAFLEPIGNVPLDLKPLNYTTNKLQVGELLYAIGHPYGQKFTLSHGLFSTAGNYNQLTGQYGFLQHSATLNPGNSGGPLLNSAGLVVGINTQQLFLKEQQSNINIINYSIPIQRALTLLDSFLKYGKPPRRCYLGAEFRAADDGSPVLFQVIEGGPAAEKLMNFRGASVVKAVNGKPIKDLHQLLEELEGAGVNPVLSLLLQRQDGSTEQVSIPVKPLQNEDLEATARHVIEKFGSINDKKTPLSIYLPQKEPQSGILSQGIYRSKKPDEGWTIAAVGDKQYGWAIGGLADFGVALRLTVFQGKLKFILRSAEIEKGTPYDAEYTFGVNMDNSPQQIIFY